MKAKRKKRTIASVAEKAILAGKGTQAVIRAIKRAFPESKTSPACIGWYRHDMRVRGLRVPPAGKGVAA